MGQRERALQLVERIYDAVVEPDAWNEFVKDLSALLGGAAVQMSLRQPDVEPTPDAYFRVGLDERYHPVFLKHAITGLPWGSLDQELFRGRFGVAGEAVQHAPIEETPFYLEFMQPQGLAARWPICHVIHAHRGQPVAGLVVYQREGSPEIDDADLGLLDSLVPHLARAYAIHSKLANVRHERSALSEVLDRLPVGVVLLDVQGRALRMNVRARDILALSDGFCLVGDRPRVSDPQEDRTLQKLIAEARDAKPVEARLEGSVMIVTRPSGRRGFPIWVGPLLAAPPEKGGDDAHSILFVADPEGGQISTAEVLQSLYHLTHAEAELVRMIAEGHSLEQVADARGVTMNTVRSQLKQVFSKTDTSRQGELVHLVLTGVASIRNEGCC